MFGRVFTGEFSEITVSAVQDLWELTSPTTAVYILLSIRVGQRSDYGNAEAEGLPIEISRVTGAVGNGPTITPIAHQTLTSAFTGTLRRNSTTQATTRTRIFSDTFNVQGGWLYMPPPEERIVVPANGGRIAVGLPVAPADALIMYSSITFMSIG